MRAADGVVDVPDRHIHRVELLIARCDRHGRLICSEDDGDDLRSMRDWVLCYHRLLDHHEQS